MLALRTTGSASMARRTSDVRADVLRYGFFYEPAFARGWLHTPLVWYVQ